MSRLDDLNTIEDAKTARRASLEQAGTFLRKNGADLHPALDEHNADISRGAVVDSASTFE